MESGKPDDQVSLVNSLLLDAGALESRIEAVLGRLESAGDHDGQMRARAVSAFRESLMEAAGRLRQQGLHPGPQGTLW